MGHPADVETQPVLQPRPQLCPQRHPSSQRPFRHRRGRFPDELLRDAEALRLPLHPVEQRRKRDPLQFPVHLDPQARRLSLFRVQSIRRHPESPLASQQDRGHDQVRLVFQHEVSALRRPGDLWKNGRMDARRIIGFLVIGTLLGLGAAAGGSPSPSQPEQPGLRSVALSGPRGAEAGCLGTDAR